MRCLVFHTHCTTFVMLHKALATSSWKRKYFTSPKAVTQTKYKITYDTLSYCYTPCMVAFSTIFLLVEILQQPIRSFAIAVIKATTDNKMKATMRKRRKSLSETDVKSDIAFLLGPPIEITNCESLIIFLTYRSTTKSHC